MSSHTATTLAFVRTSAGVVRVDADGALPDDIDATHLQRLVKGGAVVETPVPTPTPTPTPAPPVATGDTGDGTKGKSAGRSKRS